MIHIVTAFTRSPVFLDRAYESIKNLKINWHWYVVGDSNSFKSIDISKYRDTTFLHKFNGMPMHTGVNFYYDVIPDKGQWVYILDDDNLMHHNFDLIETFTQSKNCDLIVFGQQLSSNIEDVRIIDNALNIAPQQIDNGQFMVRRAGVDSLRYWPVYRGDGYFVTEMRILSWENNKDIKLVPIVASYYNAQHWLSKS